MNNPADIAAAMAALQCTAEQIAGVLARLQTRSSGAERQAKYRARKAAASVTSDITRDVTNHNENVTGDAVPRAPIRERVHDLALSLESKEVREDKGSLRSPSSAEVADPKAEVTKRVAKAETDQGLLDRVSDQWNIWARSHGSPLVARLTAKRGIHCRRRIADLMQHGHETPETAFGWLLSKCTESFYARGSPRKPLEFDQLMREDFMTRMVENAFQFQPRNGSNVNGQAQIHNSGRFANEFR